MTELATTGSFRGRTFMTCWNNAHMDSIESRQESCGKDYLSIQHGLMLFDLDKGQTVVPVSLKRTKESKIKFSSAVNRYIFSSFSARALSLLIFLVLSFLSDRVNVPFQSLHSFQVCLLCP